MLQLPLDPVKEYYYAGRMVEGGAVFTEVDKDFFDLVLTFHIQPAETSCHRIRLDGVGQQLIWFNQLDKVLPLLKIVGST